jgi:hypothetical protein
LRFAGVEADFEIAGFAERNVISGGRRNAA